MLALKDNGGPSFELVRGTVDELAAWLRPFGFFPVRPRNSIVEAARYEARVHGQRAIVVVYKSGSILVQGQPGAQSQALQWLEEACLTERNLGEQLSLF